MLRRILPGLFMLAFLPSSAQAYRYPLVLSGDSITESIAVGHRGGQGFGAQLSSALAYRQVLVGGYGFVPTHINGCCLDPGQSYYNPWKYHGKWDYRGFPFEPAEDSIYGAGGYSAHSKDGSARLTFHGNKVGVMYGTQQGGGSLNLRLDTQIPLVLRTDSTRPGTRIHWVSSSEGRHTLYLSFRGKGILEGAVVSKSLLAHSAEVEVDQVGHRSATALEYTGPLQLMSLRNLGAKLGVILFGANEEIRHLIDKRDRKKELRQGIIKRAKNFRRAGAKCLVLTHPPIYSVFHKHYPDWTKLQTQYAQSAKAAAKTAGCAFAQPWKGIWDPLHSKEEGWTADYIHPTLRGYHLMSARLAKWLVDHKSWWLG